MRSIFQRYNLKQRISRRLRADEDDAYSVVTGLEIQLQRILGETQRTAGPNF